jgi:WD40 repeat protein/serine/threonine protein kinase
MARLIPIRHSILVTAMTDETIFAEALKRHPSERKAFLDEACGDDSALREQVETLLKAHASAGDFLDVPAADQVAQAARRNDARTEADTRSNLASPNIPGPTDNLDLASELHSKEPQEAIAANSLAFLSPSTDSRYLGQLDHYDVMEVIGQGGMGIVLKAFDAKLHRVIAIKALSPQMATNGTARKRFVREAQAAAAVAHEHVVAIHAVEEAGTIPYLVMQYVPGRSLEERIQLKGPMELKEILRIGYQTACGLEAAHAQGLVHRDVKPANILLENSVERVKITDFGLARAVDDASLTKSGVIAGTPMFMSPEQARGDAVDHRTDLFSLGSVLYNACTGRPPFRASGTMAVLKRVCEDAARPIREVNPDIPEWLESAIAQLHAKDPAERIQTAAEVADLLSQHLAHLQQPSLVAKPRKIIGRHRTPFSKPVSTVWPMRKPFVAAAAILVLAVGTLAAYLLLRPGPGADPLETPTFADSSDKHFEGLKRGDISKGLLTGIGLSDLNQSPRELVAVLGNIRKFQLPDQGLRGLPATSHDGKLLAVPCGNLAVLFDAQTGERLKTVSAHTGRVICVAFSPDGKFLATGAGDGEYTAKVWNLKTGDCLATCFGHKSHIYHVSFDQDSSRLLTASADRTGRMWEVNSGKQIFVLEGHSDSVTQCAFHLNGKLLVSSSLDETVRIWDAETGKEQQCLRGHTMKVQRVVFSPDGKTLASGSEREVILWNTDTWEKTQTFPITAGWLAFDPDGKSILAANHDTRGAGHKLTRCVIATGASNSFALNNSANFGLYALSLDGKTLFATRDAPDVPYLRAYDAATGEEIKQVGHEGPVTAVAISPHGNLIATGGEDLQVKIWDLSAWKPGEPLPPVQTLKPKHPQRGPIRTVAFSPDNKFLAWGITDGSIVLWDLTADHQHRVLPGNSTSWTRIAFHPDGRILAAGGSDGRIRLWEVESGKQICEPITAHAGGVREVAFNPNGKLLASAGEDSVARVWEMPLIELVKELPTRSVCTSVAFSSDGNFLATGSDDAMLRTWDVSSLDPTQWKLKDEYQGHSSHVFACAIHPNTRFAASGAWDGTVRFWDLASGKKQSLTIGGISGRIFATAFSPQGGYLVTANENGSVSILHMPEGPAKYAPGSPVELPDAAELAKRPSAADALKHENIPEEFLKKAGGGDPMSVPAEIVAILGGEKGHTQRVASVAVSPNGKILASTGWDGKIKLWDLATGQVVHTLEGHQPYGRFLAFSPDGKLLASTGPDAKIKLWDAATNQEKATLIGHRNGEIRRVIFAPDGKTLASASEDGTAMIWDVAKGAPICTLRGHQGGLRGVCYSPDGKTLATGGDDRTVRIWDVATGWQIGVLQGHQNLVWFVAFHPAGRYLASCDHNGAILRWDLEKWRPGEANPPNVALPAHEGFVESLSWRADGKLLAYIGFDGSVRICDALHQTPHSWALRLFRPGEPAMHGLAFTPEGRYLATGNPDGTVYILRAPDAPAAFDPGPSMELPDAKELASRPSTADALKRETIPEALLKKAGSGDPQNAPEELVAILAGEKGHTQRVLSVAISPDGKVLASTGFDGTIKLWDLATGELLKTMVAHQNYGRYLAFSPDGKLLASAGFDTKVKLWDVARGEELKTLAGHTHGEIRRVAFSPDGRSLASVGEDGAAILWDTATFKPLRKFLCQQGGLWGVCFSPDGKTLATAGDDQCVRLWDLATGWLHGVLRGQKQRIRFVGYHPSGRYLASSAEDGAIMIWDLANWRPGEDKPPPGSLPGHYGFGESFAWRADGQLLASIGGDSTVRFCNLPLGTPQTRALRLFPSGETHGIAITPEGRYVATANPDNTVYILRTPIAPSPFAPTPPIKLPDPEELAKRPSPADALKREDIPKELLKKAGAGDPTKAHAQLVAVLAHYNGQIISVAISADGKYLASSGDDKPKIWDLATGQLLHTLDGHKGGVFGIAFGLRADGESGTLLLVTAGAADRTIKLWDVTTGKLIHSLSGHTADPLHVAFAPDGKWFASSDTGGTILIWDSITGKLLRRIQTATLDHGNIAVSQDGQLLAAACNDGLVHLLDPATGWQLGTLAGHQGKVRGVTFSPDNRSLVTSGEGDKTIRFWDLARMEANHAPLEGTRTMANWLACRADGRLLASPDTEYGSVNLWDLANVPPKSQEITLYPPGTRHVHGVAFTPEGRYLATANPDGTVYILRLAKTGEVFHVKSQKGLEQQPTKVLPEGMKDDRIQRGGPRGGRPGPILRPPG